MIGTGVTIAVAPVSRVDTSMLRIWRRGNTSTASTVKQLGLRFTRPHTERTDKNDISTYEGPGAEVGADTGRGII